MGVQKRVSGQLQMVPPGTIAESKVQFCYRTAVFPSWDPDAPPPEPEPEPESGSGHSSIKKRHPPRKKTQSQDSAAKNFQPEPWMISPRIRFEEFFVAMTRLAEAMFVGDDDDALRMDELYQRIVRSSEGRAKAWVNHGDKSFVRCEYGQANSMYSKAIGLDGTNPDFISGRASTHAAMQDWSAAMEDAATVVGLVDRYESGVLTGSEVKALVNLEDLGKNFYRVPSWLEGQHRQYEMRQLEERTKAAALAAESAVGSGQEGPGDKVKMSRRLTARPSEQEVVSKLGPTSKMGRSLQETKHVPLLDFASSRSGAPPVAG
jgi:hypothetical protein